VPAPLKTRFRVRGALVLALAVTLGAVPAARAALDGVDGTGFVLGAWPAHQYLPGKAANVRSPAPPGDAPSRVSMRFTVTHGQEPIFRGTRSEVATPNLWREGGVVWADWWVRVGQNWPAADAWQIVTQWHMDGPPSQPVLIFDARDNRLQFATSRGGGWTRRWRAPLERGRWYHFTLGARFSSDPARGWVTLSVDGRQVVPKTATALLEPGRSVYLKQGYYRDPAIVPAGSVFISGTRLSSAPPRRA
jgi:hypothetical protein